MTPTTNIVARLWSLCHVLRDDGITYHQYVTELTYLLFLKMAEETETEVGRHGVNIPEGLRWRDLKRRAGADLLVFYRQMLIRLGAEGSERVQEIYAGAQTSLKRPTNLKTLVDSIDALDWYSARHEGLGDLYEGLLQKNAEEKKSGAGQYFTPRPLIDCMVALAKPRAGEIVQDPAAGTGGFLIAADRHVKAETDQLFALPEAVQYFQRTQAFQGLELVQDAQRLGLMNLILHGIEGPVHVGDALSPDGAALPKADLILTNPPFGTKKGGGLPTRDDLTFPTSNKQLAFLQHVYRGLKPGGRAAVVLPDNVLFEDGVGRDVRRDLMDKCDLHTILRLPTGIFYAQGVKTNVLFFTRGRTETGNTDAVWIYDLRTGVPPFGKTRPLTRAFFAGFEAAYGDDPLGRAARTDEGPEGRFRRVTRDEVRARGDNLDIAWLREEGAGADALPPPEAIAAEIVEHLRTALEEMEELAAMLEPAEPDTLPEAAE
jgi:type I restriction enzyme M protein